MVKSGESVSLYFHCGKGSLCFLSCKKIITTFTLNIDEKPFGKPFSLNLILRQ